MKKEEQKRKVALNFLVKIDNDSGITLGYEDRLWLIRNLTDLLEEQVKAERERIIGLTEGIMYIVPSHEKYTISMQQWEVLKEEVRNDK